jgi:PiT family inorganic phosphate transporter
LSAVRWGVAGNLVVAWILTLPLSGLVSFFATLVCMRIFA